LPFVLPPQDQESTVLLESGVITPPESTSPSSSSSSSSSQLRRLLDETADLVDSPPFNRIHTLLLNALFTQLIDVQVCSQAFPPTSTQGSQPHNDPSSTATIRPSQPSEPRTRLANILAVLTRQAHVIGQTSTSSSSASGELSASNGLSLGNEYVEAMSKEVEEMESFAAVIYAGNLQEEGEALGASLNDLPTVGRSTDSLSGSELRESLGLESSSGASNDVQSQLEKVWDRAKGIAGR